MRSSIDKLIVISPSVWPGLAGQKVEGAAG
jgi:hypothetical protein